MKIKKLIAKLFLKLRIALKRKPREKSLEIQLLETQALIVSAKQQLSSLLARERALSSSISTERNSGPLLSVDYQTAGDARFTVISALRPTTVWDMLVDIEPNMPRPESTSTGFKFTHKKGGLDLPEISARKFWGDKDVAFRTSEAEEVIDLIGHLFERSTTTRDGVTHRIGVIMFVIDQNEPQSPLIRMWIGDQSKYWSSVTDTVLMAPIGPGSTIILKGGKTTV